MEEIVLKIKVQFVQWLIRLRLRPNIWHRCELDLAKLEAKKTAHRLSWIGNG